MAEQASSRFACVDQLRIGAQQRTPAESRERHDDRPGCPASPVEPTHLPGSDPCQFHPGSPFRAERFLDSSIAPSEHAFPSATRLVQCQSIVLILRKLYV